MARVHVLKGLKLQIMVRSRVIFLLKLRLKNQGTSLKAFQT